MTPNATSQPKRRDWAALDRQHQRRGTLAFTLLLSPDVLKPPVRKVFLAHRTVEHAKELSGPNGENNNQAEEYNWRYDRAEKGIYLNVEPKYMLDYACEIAFRSDTRRLPNGQQLRLALNVATNVGESQFWRGFTRGKHREHELLHAGPRVSKASGPAKGRQPGGPPGLPR